MAEKRVVKEDGETYTAGSRRPDGTFRKERRVKAGYVPQEEVAVYQTKAAKFAREVASLPPAGYAPSVSAASAETATSSMSKAQRKNEKRKQKRKEKVEDDGHGAGPDVEGATSRMEAVSFTEKAEASTKTTSSSSGVDTGALEKRLKALRKKMRQIEDLEKKQREGGKLEKEQLEKITMKEDVLDEIFAVETALKN